MFFSDYQQLCERTARNVDNDSRLVNFSLGLAGEAGEFANLIKKGVFHGHGVRPEKVKEELGDCLWYIATLATTFNLSLEDVAASNIGKLARRYPQGFSEEKSKNRED